MTEIITITGDTATDSPIEIPSSATDIQITAEPDSTATLFLTSAQSYTLKVEVRDNAMINIITMQPCGHATTKKIEHRSQLNTNSSIQWQNITLGSAAEYSLQSECLGEGARSSVDWIFYAKGNESMKINARNIFNARHGSGEMTLKGVAEDTAHVICNGMIDIGLQGGGTDTYLTEDVLMLDNTAKVDAIPGLEIKTNDVKASHSAIVTKVSPEDLYYFGSRGISEEKARRMYIEGFLSELTGNIPNASLREKVQQEIEKKYSG